MYLLVKMYCKDADLKFIFNNGSVMFLCAAARAAFKILLQQLGLIIFQELF